MAQIEPLADSSIAPALSPWLTVREAAQRARTGPRIIYHEVQAGRIHAALLGAAESLRLPALRVFRVDSVKPDTEWRLPR